MKAFAGKWIEYGKGSVTWGNLVFPLFPFPPAMSRLGSERDVSHSARGGQYQHMILHRCFFLLPSEPQLVNTGLASAMLLHSRQVQTSACSCLGERQ